MIIPIDEYIFQRGRYTTNQLSTGLVRFLHGLHGFSLFFHVLLLSSDDLTGTVYTKRPSWKTSVAGAVGSKRLRLSPRSKDGITLWTVKMGDMGGPLS